MKRTDNDPAHPPEASKEAGQVEPDAADGLTCPKCGCRHFLRVVDTRPDREGIRRRRECRNCGRRIWTREEITPPPPEMED